jgi:hypothetical protein
LPGCNTPNASLSRKVLKNDPVKNEKIAGDHFVHFISPLRKRSVLMSLSLFVLIVPKQNRLERQFSSGLRDGDGGELIFPYLDF